jgi:hypothetical protein
MSEQVNHPDHYNHGGIECIDAMVAAMGPIATAHFCHGNAFKYLWRVGTKPGNPAVQDFKKAEWYIHKAIELIENTEKDESGN